MRRVLFGVCVAGLFAVGCGSEDPPTQEEFDKGEVVNGAPSADPPSFQAAPYPEGPYGTQLDSVMEDFEFIGWRAPVDRGFDTSSFETIKLSDYYDPDGTKGYKVIMINSSAGWCSVCRAEYKGSYGTCAGTFKTCTSNANCSGGAVCEKKSMQAHYEELAPKGVVFLGTLFEDSANPPKPAKPIDLQKWTDAYEVNFPMALDPGFKLGAFFTADATPMNLVIDARTMKIIGKVLGGDVGKVFKYIDDGLNLYP